MKTGYTLDERETVIKVINRHWIDLAPVAISAATLVLVALATAFFYGRYSDKLSFVSAGLISALVVILIGLAGAILLVGIYIYRQNKLILTDMHLIQVVQNGLFGRSVSQLSLVRVQDVSAVRKGVFATLLDYGKIEVETAGEDDIFVFNLASHPQQLADECMTIHEKYAPKSASQTAEL